MATDDRGICLRYRSKGECVRQCTWSHMPLRGHIRETLIRYIKNCRAAHNPSRKIKLNGTGKLGRTYKDRLMGEVLDVFLVEAATLEGGGRTEIIADAEVREGAVVTTPTPPPRRTETAGWRSELMEQK